MDKENLIFLTFYVVPTMSALFCLFSLQEGGIGYLFLDYLVYSIVLTLFYALTYCVKILYKKDSWQYIASVLYYFLIIGYYSFAMSFYYYPIFLFIHLIFFTKNKNDIEVDLSKSILHLFAKNVPKANKVLLYVSYLLIMLSFLFYPM